MNNDFEKALAGFMEKATALVVANAPKVMPQTLGLSRGKKFIRVIRVDASSRSAWAFIRIDNGDVLKPASWSTPAKHARGNIFDQHNGMLHVGPYGPAYLR